MLNRLRVLILVVLCQATDKIFHTIGILHTDTHQKICWCVAYYYMPNRCLAYYYMPQCCLAYLFMLNSCSAFQHIPNWPIPYVPNWYSAFTNSAFGIRRTPYSTRHGRGKTLHRSSAGVAARAGDHLRGCEPHRLVLLQGRRPSTHEMTARDDVGLRANVCGPCLAGRDWAWLGVIGCDLA